MKTLKISDDVHQKLTALLGELTAQTMKMQTYQDAIEALLTQSVIVPPELLKEVETFINKNKHLGYTSKEEFIRDAIRFRLQWLKDEYEYFEVPKVDIEKMNEIMETLNAPTNAIRYIRETIENAVKRVFDEYQSRKHELNEKVVKKLEDKLKTIEQYWETWRRQSKQHVESIETKLP